LRLFALIIAWLLAAPALAQGVQQTKGEFEDKFRQLDEVLPDPNVYRNASGAPGHQYWQQQADYRINARLDEDARRLTAEATITYKNNSPDTLPWIWMQLDQNVFRKDSMAELTNTFGGPGRRGPAVRAASGSEPAKLSLEELRRQQAMADKSYGYDINRVSLANGRELSHTIVGTLMRIDLPTPLRPGQSVSFNIDWAFNIVEENTIYARSGYEHFPDDPREGGNDIFLFAQWFPRLVAYSDYEGWHNKEFLGRGEFTLEFGNYDVSMTVPNDHILSSTGVLANPAAVLSSTQRAMPPNQSSSSHPKRLKQTSRAIRPVTRPGDTPRVTSATLPGQQAVSSCGMRRATNSQALPTKRSWRCRIGLKKVASCGANIPLPRWFIP